MANSVPMDRSHTVPYMSQILSDIGLSSLNDWAAWMIISGASEDELLIELYKQPEFISRFHGYFELQKQGQPLPSIAEMLDYEKTVIAIANQWNMPLTRDEIQTSIGNGVSVREFQERIEMNADAIYQQPLETRQALNDLYGIHDGILLKAFLDPEKEFAALQTQYGAAQVAGAASKSGWGNLSAEQAENLYRTGMDRNRALTSFGELYRMRGLFASAGTLERWITPDDQLALLSGDAAITEEVANRVDTRKAEFQRGGAGTQTEEGLSGYGAAD